MAQYLGGKENPIKGFKNDICIYVKIIPPGATFPDKLNFDSKIQPVIEPEKEASENTTEIEVDKGAET